MSELLLVERQDRVVRLVMNRPQKRNALSFALCRELVDAIGHADRDLSVGAIVLAANGTCFSAGMDLEEVGGLRPEDISEVHEQLFTMPFRLNKPLIGEIDGAALGGGMGLVANCHIAMASEQARFGLTEIRLGLWPFLIFRTVLAAVGERRAVELALTGRIFGPEEAKELGLIHEVTRDVHVRAMEVAWELSKSSPTAIRNGLTFVQEIRGKDWQKAGLIGRRMREEIFSSGDFLEGIRSFREKRLPKWPSLSQ